MPCCENTGESGCKGVRVQGFDSAGKEKNSFDELVEIRALLTAADSSTMRHMKTLALSISVYHLP
jgi:predicted metal-binding protein